MAMSAAPFWRRKIPASTLSVYQANFDVGVRVDWRTLSEFPLQTYPKLRRGRHAQMDQKLLERFSLTRTIYG